MTRKTILIVIAELLIVVIVFSVLGYIITHVSEVK